MLEAFGVDAMSSLLKRNFARHTLESSELSIKQASPARVDGSEETLTDRGAYV